MTKVARNISIVTHARACWLVTCWLLVASQLGGCPKHAVPAKANSVVEPVDVVSWNLKHLGRASQDIEAVARTLALVQPEIIALQEVNTTPSGTEAAWRLVTLLAEKTKTRFCLGLSVVPSEGRERYAILWKESVFSYVTTSGAVKPACEKFAFTLPLFIRTAEKIVREPAFATLQHKLTARKIIIASVHLVPSGKSPQDEVGPAFEALPVKGETNFNIPIALMGDFNLSAKHPAFAPALQAGFTPVLPHDLKTSLKMKRKEYNKPYDNFFVRGTHCKGVGIIDVYALFAEMDARTIYNNLSDHAPIHMTCDF